MEKSESEGAIGDQQPWQSYHTVYTNGKAGMDGVDKEKVQRIVYEMSKGSKYFENEERKEAFIRQKIENLRAQFQNLTASNITHFQKVADKRISELEATRDLSRTWLHVDMDAFYAAVETLSNPSLKGKPMAVGSLSMISTANYEARKFGVRAAMPGFIARKLCPDLIFVPTDFKKYTYYSDLTRKVFQNYDPNFMATSLDEAYVDITEVCRERDITGAEVAKELRSRVYEETGLTCSAGVAPNRLLAKVCSDINKPNGQFVLPNDRMAVMTFIASLPIRKIGGIGKVTEKILRDVFGITTCEEMLQKGALLCAVFSHSTADFFLSVGLGLGGTDTPKLKSRKSMSSERTFSATGDAALLYRKLAEIAETVSTDLEKEGLSGRTLTLKLKTASFEVRTRAVTLQQYIFSRDDIFRYASNLLKAELPVSLRLIGLRVSHFNEDKVAALVDPTQKTLTTFVISGGTSRNNVDGQNSLGSNVDLHFMNQRESFVSIDSHEICQYEFGGPSGCNQLPNYNCNSCSSTKNVCEQEQISELSNSETAAKVKRTDMALHIPKSNEKKLSKGFEVDSAVLKELDPLNGDTNALGIHDKLNREVITLGSESASSYGQTEQLVWVDDYKCSLCGAELPPSFIYERQEHSDFHLAERLQKEESRTGTSTRSFAQKRIVAEDNIASESRGKKHKLALKQSRHVTIDSFFLKSNQNL